MTDPAGPTPDRVAAGLAEVRRRIESAGGDPAAVRVVAVTKGFDVDAVEAALAAGITDIGENFAQEVVRKVGVLGKAGEAGDAGEAGERTTFTLHFVGQLQRNKVRVLAPHVDLYQSVDRSALGRELAVRAPGAAVLVQVNLTDDPARGGCRPDDVPGLAAELADAGLDVRGLMAVAPIGPAEGSRVAFGRVRELADRLGLPERSYGMSDDLEAAVAEGATMVRLGTALFGPRPRRPRHP